MKTFTFEQQKIWQPRTTRENILYETLATKKHYQDPDAEEFRETNLSKEAYCYHNNFVNYLNIGYNTHQSIVLQPHVFWNTILNELSGYITENPEKCRHLFTDSDDKKEILIDCPGIIPPLDVFEAKLRELVPTNIDAFLPNFTTLTPQARLANIAAFMEAASPYYDYSMFACGYNAIKVEGTEEDWRKIADLSSYFTELFPELTKWLNGITETINQFIKWVQDGDGDSVAKILTGTRVGSGGQTAISGWITKFFRNLPGQPQACHFPSHIAKVEYKVIGPGITREFFLNFGLFSSRLDDGFIVPDYNFVINEKLSYLEGAQ